MAESFARVTAEPIDPARLLDDTLSPDDGAALLFWGVVRNRNDGRTVSRLEYSAYAEMAEREMGRIADEARERFGTGRIRVIHRIGTLAVGEASVGIAVASPHRAEAYEASRYVIEQLKQRVPVWKREGYVDGDAEWVPGFTAAVAETA
jgi:molybdopterin synthase catalytic subunit